VSIKPAAAQRAMPAFWGSSAVKPNMRQSIGRLDSSAISFFLSVETFQRLSDLVILKRILNKTPLVSLFGLALGRRISAWDVIVTSRFVLFMR
jgi:hypothetical protein